MYFPLEINEELADMLRTVTDLYSQLNAYLEKHKEDSLEEYPLKPICKASDSAANMITDISDVIAHDIACQAFEIEKKRNNNQSNSENHVSE